MIAKVPLILDPQPEGGYTVTSPIQHMNIWIEGHEGYELSTEEILLLKAMSQFLFKDVGMIRSEIS
ncbi:MAG: hypothetical protein OXC95_04560 [Dehalococcoidia bacterium]|nr:hypothetical protein [Dehalococcoidia bacterium]